MAKAPSRSTPQRRLEVRLPPPVPDGSYYVESLGRFVDRLVGTERDRRKAAKETAALTMTQAEWGEQDPEPIEPPPPVPDGDDSGTHGNHPADIETR